MNNKLNREELVDLVAKIIDCEGSEDEINEMMELVKKNVYDPNVSDLIFWNEDNLTAEQIVDRALNYKPILL